jgi:hypothetical protein
MTSRERVELALDHQEPDRIPLDLGGSTVTGMHVSTVYRLRQALDLDPPEVPVKVVEPFQMLGEIKPDLVDALGVDFVSLRGTGTLFGFRQEGWKPWAAFDGTPMLVPAGFNTEPESNGDLLLYPKGDKSASPSGRMPAGGWYFDAIIRQPPIDDHALNVEDNLEEFGHVSDEELEHYRLEAEKLHTETDKAILAGFPHLSFGDIAHVPAPMLKNPKGIRDFERQCEINLANLERLYQAVGDRVMVVQVNSADFGTQRGLLVSPKTYRNLFKPFHTALNDWVHQHTSWKTFIHSCGAVASLIPDFVDAGFDVLNPVQTSAAGMDPLALKRKFGDQLVFMGGGVDTQQTLPFGTPEQVRQEARERMRILGPGGGFIFNPVHNVQPRVPVENLLAMYETVREHGLYPIR